MYVWYRVCQVVHFRPPAPSTRRVIGPPGGSLNRPSGGHADSMDVPTAGSPPAGGHVCIYIYIYMSVSLSVRSLAAKARRLFCLRSLSERVIVPVILSGSAPASLLATCRAAAALLPRRCCASRLPITCMFSFLLLALCLLFRGRRVVSTPNSPSPGHILLARWFAYGLTGLP